jgi:uncharacterized protein (DUF779 family)
MFDGEMIISVMQNIHYTINLWVVLSLYKFWREVDQKIDQVDGDGDYLIERLKREMRQKRKERIVRNKN